MKRAILAALKHVYRAIPLRSLRALAFGVYARSVRKRRVIEEIDGLRFDLDLSEMIDLTSYLGQFEPEVVAAIHRSTLPGMTVLDVGANVGVHALRFARLVGPQGKVVAFEPTDFAFAKLARNAALNPMEQLQIVKVALGQESAQGQVVNFRASWQTDGRRVDGPSIVDFARLDDWCDAHGIKHVDIVKTDVDGNEFPLMAGGLRIIEESRPLFLMEAATLHFESDETNPFLLLERIGYSFELLSNGTALSAKDIRNRLPGHDPQMTFSINIMARPRAEACPP
jgi:FkbM family methyltransferase